MALGEIGTLAWTRRTNGLLSRGEYGSYFAAVLRAQARSGPRLLMYRIGRPSTGATVDVDQLTIPDSALAEQAVSACRAVQSEATVQHNYRSFLFARALGLLGGIPHDPEALFVAAMFHDQGAYDVVAGRCFTLRGAQEAEQTMLAAGFAAPVATAAAEAVTLHLNPEVAVEQGAEAHLLHDGVLLDAVGLRAWDLDPSCVDSVRAAHPRHGFSQEASRLLCRQAKAIPKCRTAAAIRGGFRIAVRLGPWQD